MGRGGEEVLVVLWGVGGGGEREGFGKFGGRWEEKGERRFWYIWCDREEEGREKVLVNLVGGGRRRGERRFW